MIAIVQALGFRFKRQDGSHAHYEKLADATGLRRLVTVDVSMREFREDIVKSMIRQCGVKREDFYCATKRTARKIGKG